MPAALHAQGRARVLCMWCRQGVVASRLKPCTTTTPSTDPAMAAAASSGDAVLPLADAPRKRLRVKTNVQEASFSPFPADEVTDAHRAVYLVTFPHPQQAESADGRVFAAPETLTREGIALALRDAASHPMHTEQWRRRHPGSHPPTAEIQMLTVFREFHAGVNGARGHGHYHVAVLFSTSVRFAPLKRALLWVHGLATHWSCTHTGYWSAVRYGRMPTRTKPLAALDPAPFAWALASPHPPLDTCVYEPTTARALEARRLRLEQDASARGKAPPRVREVDVWPLVVASGVRMSANSMHAEQRLIQYAKAHCSDAMIAFLFKNRHRLAAFIRDAWAWEEVESLLERADRPRMEVLHRACSAACQCRGAWLQYVAMSLYANGIDARELCHYTLNALERGRHESVKAVVLLGRRGGEGKSLFFQPLGALFGNEYVQRTPQPGRFPLLGLDTKKVALLDEWHFDQDVLPLPIQLLWLEGKPVPITLPQNIAGQSGHLMYHGDAPIFITAPEEVLRGMANTGMAGPTGQWSMLLRRLKLFHFTVPIPEPVHAIEPCARCFASFVLEQARAWRAATAAA